MNDMLVRVTGNKREIGVPVLKTSSFKRKNTMPTSNVGKRPLKTGVPIKRNIISKEIKGEIQKYLNSNKEQRLSGRRTGNQLDLNNNENMVIQIFQSCVFNRDKTEKVARRIHSSDSKPIKTYTGLNDSCSKNNANGKCTEKTEEVKGVSDRKNDKSKRETQLKCNNIKNFGNKHVRNSDSESSEDDLRHKHPSRRLQLERFQDSLPTRRVGVSCGVERENYPNRLKSVVVPIINNPDYSESTRKRHRETKEHVCSKMWKNVLDSAHLMVEETCFKEPSDTIKADSDDDSELDYESSLHKYVFLKKSSNEKKRFKGMLEDPKSSELMKEFYIPPAFVELMSYKTIQGQVAEESLKEICKLKKWPEPTFTCISSEKGFLYSCTLKTKTFIPRNPASNEDLAKELAALDCLEWLGLQ